VAQCDGMALLLCVDLALERPSDIKSCSERIDAVLLLLPTLPPSHDAPHSIGAGR
jgi:hypothetical protein